MYKKIILACFVSILFSGITYSQENKEKFEPTGKIIARAFFDVGLQNFDAHNKPEFGFDITRALLGYSYQFLSSWTATVVIDGASGNSAGKIEPHIRNAFVNYKHNDFDISIGMLGLYQFSIQESYWRHRYVQKTFQDLNKMGYAADIGITVAYKFSNILLADLSMTNGEGYKKVVRNRSTKFSGGVSVSPVKNLVIRAYGDIYTESEDMHDQLPDGVVVASYTNQKVLSLFVGYQNDCFSGGGEFSKLFDKGFIKDKSCYGISAFVSGKVEKEWRVFGRYDYLKSNSPENFTANWNELDGHMAIIGAEYQPFKQLKTAPNFRLFNPNNAKARPQFLISFEFNL
jgi:hypothetical protein